MRKLFAVLNFNEKNISSFFISGKIKVQNDFNDSSHVYSSSCGISPAMCIDVQRVGFSNFVLILLEDIVFISSCKRIPNSSEVYCGKLILSEHVPRP